MSLTMMSLSAALMIAVIAVIRVLALNRLPKRTFPVLWGVVILRLLLPISIPSALSVYSLAGRFEPEGAAVTVQYGLPDTAQFAADIPLRAGTASGVSPQMPDIWAVVWTIGMLLSALFFSFSYLKCRREFRESLPVQSETAEKWLCTHRLRRAMEIRCSDRISAPLTYGIFRPVILLPKAFDWESGDVNYVLEHEYVHIRRLDAAAKLVFAAALCVHWFNPAVWLMYALANRDLELACDEAVLRALGEQGKTAYARALVRMEEARSGGGTLFAHFSKNLIEERIIAIMKIRKKSWAAVMAAGALVLGVTTVFATSAQGAENGMDQVSVLKGDDTLISYVDPDSGTVYYSRDNGVTWRREEELTAGGFDDGKIEWWTAEEYAAWLEKEKEELWSIIGDRSWTASAGWFTWTRELVEETIAGYEQTLRDIQNGMKVSKPILDENGAVLMLGSWPSQEESVAETAETDAADTVGNCRAGKAWLSENEALLKEYKKFGLTYDDQVLYYKGQKVHIFIDSVDIGGNTAIAFQYLNDEGTVDIHTVWKEGKNADGSTDPFGTLTGIVEYASGELDRRLPRLSQETLGGEAYEDTDTGKSFQESMKKYAEFGITFVESGSFGNVYYHGKLVDALIDHAPDGSYRTISSVEKSGIRVRTVYDENGRLVGVEKIK